MESHSKEVEAEKRVKGSFFVDYVRILKSRKDVDWSRYLNQEDMVFLSQGIDISKWYPFDTFERMGLAILKAVAGGSMDAVRIFGHQSIDNFVELHEKLLCEDDPMESLMRFQVLRNSYFNFEAIEIQLLSGKYAKFRICYGMSAMAEEAATWQAVGFFERLLELSGAINIKQNFLVKAWEGEPETLVEFNWSEAGSNKQVKGILFLDYVRMIKSRKDLDWSKYLKPVDFGFLKQKIVDTDWYPMDSFERMGVAVIKEMAQGKMEAVRMFGRNSVDTLLATHGSLIRKGDPLESLMRYQVLRKSFFDFDAVEIDFVSAGYAKLKIYYGMGMLAEEAATWQAVGFFERLLEIAGGVNIEHNFMSKTWDGDPTTILELSWS